MYTVYSIVGEGEEREDSKIEYIILLYSHYTVESVLFLFFHENIYSLLVMGLANVVDFYALPTVNAVLEYKFSFLLIPIISHRGRRAKDIFAPPKRLPREGIPPLYSLYYLSRLLTRYAISLSKVTLSFKLYMSTLISGGTGFIVACNCIEGVIKLGQPSGTISASRITQ